MLNGDLVTNRHTDPRAGAVVDAAARQLYCAG
jgi:hypothetical protein